MKYHLAQVNIARMRGSLNADCMAGLVRRIEEMNRLAEQSRGFVWRLPGTEVTLDRLRVFEDYFVPFEPERLFYNLSVWETIEDLRHYAFKTAHAEMLRDKHLWMELFDPAHLALWWIKAGHLPSIDQSAERLSTLHQRGPTPYAFTLKHACPKPED